MLNVTAEVYQNKCLKALFDGRTRAGKKKHQLRQDSARPHIAKTTMKWLEDNGVQVVQNWPARSPDLNPIEKLWAYLALLVSRRGPLDRAELIKFVKEEWQKVVCGGELIPALIGAEAKRCQEVIDAKGAVIN